MAKIRQYPLITVVVRNLSEKPLRIVLERTVLRIPPEEEISCLLTERQQTILNNLIYGNNAPYKDFLEIM